ncbi:glycosyltransferase [Marinobacter salicampi]|uniref:glycosyltransferase n=1 Tax=Marinobacter salicampi TaxID=435907 RepID=UPI00140DAEE3|nr:glycosyltransferase [Marinobacter salicampi]
MIFVTVGTQLSFDRLVQMADEWAGLHPQEQVFVQSGISCFMPKHCESTPFTSPDEWERLFQSANRIISHAGMGTIIKSLEFAKPLVVVPRKASLGEHRNDHQRATAARFSDFENVTIVDDAPGLARALSASSVSAQAGGDDPLIRPNLEMLISEIRRFAHDTS